MLLTDDRKTLLEALETAPIEELSALKAIGEEFAPSAETIPQRPTAEKAAVLDEATWEHRKVAGGFIGHVLSAASAMSCRRPRPRSVSGKNSCPMLQGTLSYMYRRMGCLRLLVSRRSPSFRGNRGGDSGRETRFALGARRQALGGLAA